MTYIIGENEVSFSEAVRHHGVKGMHWGVRRKNDRAEYSKDLVLKKGSTVQNISPKTETQLKGRAVFAAHTTADRLNYKANYGSYLKEWSSRTVYQNDLKVVNDIKIPSEEKAVKTFKETFAKDPEGMARSIAKAKADTDLFANIGKSLGLDSESRAYKKYSSAGEAWMNTKGYAIFNKTLTSSNEYKARTAYYNELLGKGYGGIRDVHDINNSYKSESPVIIFDTGKLKRGTAKKLSQREIDAALVDYENKI